MNERKKPSSGWRVAGLVLLAVLCIAVAELTASYFFAPAFFDRVVATPVRNGVQAVTAFCTQTAQRTASLASELADGLRQTLQALIPEETEPEPEPVDTEPLAADMEDAQLADGPLLDYDIVLSALSVTQLRTDAAGAVLTGGVMEIRYFDQTEEPWASSAYGSDRIAGYGCGPTVMAMAAASMTGADTDPARMAQWAVQNGHWAPKGGSYYSLIPGAAAAFGMTAQAAPALTAQAIEEALLAGDLLVALVGPGHFTRGGHFILLRGLTLSGTVLVADPASQERSLMEWDAQLIIDELSTTRRDGAPLWILSRQDGEYGE